MRGLLTSINAVRPGTVDALLDHLAGNPDAEPIAGGTDVMVRLEAGATPAAGYVDMSGLGHELRYVRQDGDALEIGALATFWDVRGNDEAVARFPLLEATARTVGAVQIQGRGTWAGNVVNGSPAADGVAALLAYDAELVLRSKSGRRTTPLHGFYTGYKKMGIGRGEIVAAIRLPLVEPDRCHAFHKVGTRRAQAITKVGLCLNERADGTHRVVGISLAPYVIRYTGIEDVLNRPGAPVLRDLSAVIATDVQPIDDVRSTAEYRRRVFRSLLLSEVLPT